MTGFQAAYHFDEAPTCLIYPITKEKDNKMQVAIYRHLGLRVDQNFLTLFASMALATYVTDSIGMFP